MAEGTAAAPAQAPGDPAAAAKTADGGEATGQEEAGASLATAEASSTSMQVGESSSSKASPAADDADIAAAIEELLPEDAPAGHECHNKVRFLYNHKWPHAEFLYNNGISKIRFQTTQGMCGTPEICLRLARLCYLQFEQGKAPDEIKEYRDNFQKQIKALRDGPPQKEVVKKEKVVKLKTRTTSTQFDSCNNSFHFAFIESSDWQKDPDEKKKKFTLRGKKFATNDEAREACEMLRLKCEEEGLTREELNVLRDEIYNKLGDSENVPANTDKKRKVEDNEEHPETGEIEDLPVKKEKKKKKENKEELQEVKRKTIDSADVKEVVPPVAEGIPSDPTEDAPPDHAAWGLVKNIENREICRFHYKKENGEKINVQTTYRAAGGRENALRIARLCYLKFEQGATKPEVEAYKLMLYQGVVGKAAVQNHMPVATEDKKVKKRATEDKKVVENGETARPPKRRRSSGGVQEHVDLLRREGRQEGALVIKGRASDRKNSSINGTYAMLASGFDGSRAYEKIVDGGPSRFLTYQASKSRWKICEALQADKAFAFLADDRSRGDAKGTMSPAGVTPQQWRVFDGKGDGYNIDPAVQCLDLNAAVAATPDANGEAEKKTHPVEKTQEVSSDSSSASSNDSDSDSDDSSASSSASAKRQQPAVARSTNGAATTAATSHQEASLPVTASPSPDTSAGDQLRRPPQQSRGKVCAKLLVRSELRCGCHFQKLKDCPQRQ